MGPEASLPAGGPGGAGWIGRGGRPGFGRSLRGVDAVDQSGAAPRRGLLGFPSTRISDLVWLDTVPGMLAFDDPVAVHDFRLAHAAAVDTALPAVDSLRLIKEAARELE